MEIKLIALDLDKTLLKTYFELHPENVKAVKRAQEQGVEVIIATGRSPQASYKFARELGIYEHSHHMVCFNGAYVVNLKTGEVLIDKELPSNTIKQMINFSKNYHVNFWGYGVDGGIGYILRHSLTIWVIKRFNRRKLIKVNENSDVRMYKILLVGWNKRIFKIVEQLKELGIAEIIVSKKGRFRKVVEITDINISKASGVKHLAKMWNIKREEVMSIGDSMNDYKLLEWSGVGVAMKNSDDDLFNVANEITDGYKDAGVAKAIYKHIKDIASNS